MPAPSNQALADAIVAASGSTMKCIEAIGVAHKHDDAKDILTRAMQMAESREDHVLIGRLKKSFKTLAKKPSTAIAKRAAKPIDGKASIVAKDDLPSLGASIAFIQEEIDEIGRKAMRAALPLKLKQGLACLKAQAIYTALESAKGGRPKNLPDSGKFPEDAAETPSSFNDWIHQQSISSGSAYDYMRAVEGLGLDHKAGEKQLLTAYAAAAKKAGGDLSITKLKGLAAPPEKEPEQEEDPNTPEAKAGEARVFIHDYIRRWDHGVKAALLEWADKAALQELDEFLTNTRDHIRKRIKSAAK
jgi:hypothetical protein